MSLCPEHRAESERWLDYFATPQPGGVRVQQTGRPAARDVVEDRRARARDKAALVRRQRALVAEACRRECG